MTNQTHTHQLQKSFKRETVNRIKEIFTDAELGIYIQSSKQTEYTIQINILRPNKMLTIESMKKKKQIPNENYNNLTNIIVAHRSSYTISLFILLRLLFFSLQRPVLT